MSNILDEKQLNTKRKFMISKKKLLGSLVLTFFMPFIGMLYIGQIKKSVIYFFGGILTSLSALLLTHYGFFKYYDTGKVVLYFMFVFRIIASIHCYIIIKNNKLTKIYWFSRWYWLLLIFIIVLSFLASIKILFLEPYNFINKNNFNNITNAKMYVLVTKPLYRYLKAKKERDLNFPDKDQLVILRMYNSYLVSRVIALPGDTVEIKNNILYINNIRRSDKFNKSIIAIISDTQALYKGSSYKITIEDNHLLLSSDNLTLYPDLYMAHKQRLIGEVKYLIWNYDSKKFILKKLDK